MIGVTDWRDATEEDRTYVDLFGINLLVDSFIVLAVVVAVEEVTSFCLTRHILVRRPRSILRNESSSGLSVSPQFSKLVNIVVRSNWKPESSLYAPGIEPGPALGLIDAV